MTDAIIHTGRARGDADGRFALLGASAAAAALSGAAAAGVAGLGGGASTAALAALVSLAGIAIGYLLGRRHGVAAKATRVLMFRVADELAQYRAFTRLMRDQGARIVESTSGAAMMIIAGLSEMDAAIDRMRMLAHRASSADVAELRSLVEAVGAPVNDILGHLQFQDVTQQQIGFLSRLSLVLDDHMVQLARQLDDRRGMDRVGRFKEMFDQALGDCVMDSQRDDHHAASGLTVREDAGSKLEMF